MNQRRRKAFGQHFLKDRRVLHRIVRVIAPAPGETVIEVGAGRGILTFALAKRDCRVVAVEKDPAFIPRLREPGFPNLEVVEADVLKMDLESLVPDGQAVIAGNLPYSISSPLLFKVLSARDIFSRCVFLLQKEVAQRLCASPGTKKYAPLSILFENHFRRRLRFTVPPAAFFPPPRVDSALVSLEKRQAPVVSFADEEDFHTFLKACFGQRRKTLFNNLKLRAGGRERLERAYDRAGLDSRVRAEAVPLEKLAGLYSLLEKPAREVGR